MPRSNSSKPTPAAIGISPNIASRFSSIAGSLTFIQQGVRHETFMGYPHETRKSLRALRKRLANLLANCVFVRGY